MSDLTKVRQPGDSIRTHDVSELLAVPTPCFVTVLLYDPYGGPEEGGWYFDYETPVETHLCANPLVLSLVANRVFSDRYSNDDRYPVSSVLSDGEYVVRVGDAPDSGYPDERPRYC